jgi:gluconokinase
MISIYRGRLSETRVVTPGRYDSGVTAAELDADFPKVVVMGVSGAGKSTIGHLLAERAGVPFIDADDLHPDTNVAKMAAGRPLDDSDRKPWLELVGQYVSDADGGIVAACSSLKRSYRDLLRLHNPGLLFVHLTGVRALIKERQGDRKNHFMPPALMESQFASIEPLEDDERGFDVDVSASPDDVVTRIQQKLRAVSRFDASRPVP